MINYTTVTPKNSYCVLFARLIQEWSKGDIRQDSFERVKDGEWIGAVVAYRTYWYTPSFLPMSLSDIVGISLWGQNALSLTVVHEGYRGRGIALEMVKRKPVNKTMVAARNRASVRLCLKAGYVLTDVELHFGRPILILEKKDEQHNDITPIQT